MALHWIASFAARVELLFHGCRSKGYVLWRPWGKQYPERIASDFLENKTAPLQRSRSRRNRHEALSRFVLYDRFGTLAPYPTELLLERTKRAVDVPDRDVEAVTG